MNVFFEMPENEALYIDQYDVKAGRWPENSREAVLVLTQNGAVSDYICYAFGLRDSEELDKMIQDFSNGLEVETDQTYYTWLYEDFLGTNFKVVPAYKCYKYDENNKIYTDMRKNTDYMRDLVSSSYDLKIVGIPAMLKCSSRTKNGKTYIFGKSGAHTKIVEGNYANYGS